ncbi:transcriptional regulator, PadR family [Streptomyces sp. WMMB 714]|uniref:PadR family transcriptional regulator n=1 Tax=Streptomyces sp. WMMB 714 TaxID=1286822 RepID=UPI0005F79F6E|nr:PadR family transcriptional regulator [Streptomyces sp. WMMB 714]SCK12076.1 transcriptional regulator, PadR family [Streptomyces sp. WMMB 714]
MPPVFAHGRLRLYLLKLLDEAPRHGYEVIRLLEERFQGLYAPSAGTVYPRLAKLRDEGLVSHTTEAGGRKVYSITDAGREELANRQGELAELEVEISESLTALAADIREDVSGSARDLRREMAAQAERARAGNGKGARADAGWGDRESWQRTKEEMKRARDEWKEQARRAKRETQQAKRRAKEAEARAAAVEEVQRIAKDVQEQVQSRARSGDWPGAVRDGMSQLAREMGNLGRLTAHTTSWFPSQEAERPDTGAGGAADGTPPPAPVTEPDWAREKGTSSGDPGRDLERLLDHFRDDVRDAARDNGVTEDQLREARRHLSAAAARLVLLLKDPESYGHLGE